MWGENGLKGCHLPPPRPITKLQGGRGKMRRGENGCHQGEASPLSNTMHQA